MKKALFLFFSLVCFAGLHAQTPVPGTFYKHLRGNINKTLGITMDLWFNGTEYRGFYYYDSKRIPIYLSGTTNASGALGLMESVEGETTGSFSGSFATGNMFTGTWSNKDQTKSFPFTLVEDYSKGSVPMMMIGMEQRVLLDDSKTGDDDPHFDISQFVMIPDAMQGGIAAKIQPYYGDSLMAPGTNENKIMEALAATFHEWAADYQSMKSEYEGGDAFGLQWESTQGHEVVINDCSILCVSSGGYEYTGGAHGNYWTTYYTVDLASGTFLEEKDIFVAGYQAKLQPLLEAKYRETYEISPDEPLSEILFVEHIEPNGNFFVMPNGMGYLYNIYEIQSYAQGAAELFFTWEEIAPFVKADSPLQRVIKAKP